MRTYDPLQLDVSRETLARLERYAETLQRWNRSINLVAPSTLSEFWQRHILDSVQVFDQAPKYARHWVDLGSGGGLPGMVCAILAAEAMPKCQFTLVESDKRKSAFLMTAAQSLGLSLAVLPERAEQLAPLQADVISARALAALPQLLSFVSRHLKPDGVALLPKGKAYEQELAAASSEWQFDVKLVKSQTDTLARILIIKELCRG